MRRCDQAIRLALVAVEYLLALIRAWPGTGSLRVRLAYIAPTP